MVQGKPRIQRQMAMWWEQYRMPPGSTRRYQYSIFDKIQVDRSTVNLEDAASLSRGMPRIDLLVIAPEGVQLVELKPNAQLKDVGQVIMYRKYLQRDIFLQQHLTRPVSMHMVTLKENASVRAACDAEGIQYHVIPLSELPPPPD
jgi:hypothetical protein